MTDSNPLELAKSDYQAIISKIKSDTVVGIDAQYTHAVIIEYLKQISGRLDRIEQKFKEL